MNTVTGNDQAASVTSECVCVCVWGSDSDPGGQQVSERFRLDWTDELVSCDEVMVARLDGRGSGSQGQQILQDIYQRLGLVETEDLRSVLQWVH